MYVNALALCEYLSERYRFNCDNVSRILNLSFTTKKKKISRKYRLGKDALKEALRALCWGREVIWSKKFELLHLYSFLREKGNKINDRASSEVLQIYFKKIQYANLQHLFTFLVKSGCSVEEHFHNFVEIIIRSKHCLLVVQS